MTDSDEVKLLPPKAIYVSFVEGRYGSHIQKWAHEPFDGATEYTRPPVVTDEVVERLRDALDLQGGSCAETLQDGKVVPDTSIYWFYGHQIDVPALARAIASMPAVVSGGQGECHGLDTPERICFYEQDFYVLSNFSAFNLYWKDMTFHTLEAAYHWEKFQTGTTKAERQAAAAIWCAPSAHEAFKIAQQKKALRRPDWDDVKLDIMRDLLRAKATQHEYVRRKLLASGDRELVENSWRDDYWGWGPNRDGQNMLGKLWMEVRSELRAAQPEIGE